MAGFKSSELILNKDGSVYHLSLKPDNIADLIFTVGDPGRVHRVSSHFDTIDFEMNKREFITHTGKIGNKKVTVMSTGMGTSNIEILMTELDLLANYDFRNKRFKQRRKKLKIIRLGTSGSIQSDLSIGSILLSEKAVGFDNLLSFYRFSESPENADFSEQLRKSLEIDIYPYTVDADSDLMKQLSGKPFVNGVTVTSPGFYAPQGREINIKLRYPEMLQRMCYFQHKNRWLTNFEMETSAYYAFADILGHKAISVNAILANRINGRYSADSNKVVDKMISLVLDRI